ncbi:MAG TPA: FAD-dependent oxidoreductase, partial [Beijerinckiaceae bacterium]|nr:FAD-dependent oxidoreductase [Beijerinckiaceae bacterium]
MPYPGAPPTDGRLRVRTRARPARSPSAKAPPSVPGCVAERIWFAGEHLSATQPGTVGGAFAEGERAARALVRTLSRPSLGG